MRARIDLLPQFLASDTLRSGGGKKIGREKRVLENKKEQKKKRKKAIFFIIATQTGISQPKSARLTKLSVYDSST